MAQYRLFNFEEDDSTDLVNRQHLAAMPYGLYKGFDYDPTSAGTNLVLSHLVTGYKEVDENLVETPLMGMVRSRQGCNVYETAALTIHVTNNAANANPRIDLVVLEHEYVALTGGTLAGYTVILGTPSATPVVPALTFPEKQVIIGQIYWPASAAAITTSGVIYTRAKSASFNGETGNAIQNSLAYDGTDTLSSILSSSQYRLANISSDYIEVSSLDIPFTGFTSSANEINQITIRTLQRIRFIAGGNILMDGADSIHIEAGQEVTFIDLKNTPLAVGSTSTYVMVLGNQVRKDSITKMFSQLVLNKGTASVGVTGMAILDNNGNYYELAFDFAAVAIGGISGNDILSDSTIPNTKEGGIICVKLVNTGTPGIVGTLNQGSALTGYKSFENFLGTSQPVYEGDYLFLLETETEYIILVQTGHTLNLMKLYNAYHDVTQTEEKVYTKTQSTGWKILPLGNFDTASGVLAITDEGNSFIANVPPADLGGQLKDIKISRGGGLPAVAPNGLIVNIKFVHSGYVPGTSEPFLFDAVTFGSNITLPLDDSHSSPTGGAGILHLMTIYPDADIYTFRKSNGKWDMIAAAPRPDTYVRIKALEAGQVALAASQYSIENWHTVGAGGEPAYTTGSGTMRFRKDSAGRVFFDGTFVTTATAAGTIGVCTLPAGYFNSTKQCQGPVDYNAPGTGVSNHGFVRITTGGLVQIWVDTTSSGSTTYLDLVSFSTT